MSYAVAIDGPAGAGKSTIARLAAKKMNLVYVDTGAMYRAMALFMLREGICKKCEEADITIRYENGEQAVYLNGENVNALLRTEEVSHMAAVTSARREVRVKLVDLQKQLAATTDVIMDGRDIGTCVLPDADVKIYLTADSRVRAERRCAQLREKGEPCDIEEIERKIIERDWQDTHREESPLRQAADAVLVDTSDMTIDEVVERIKNIAGRKKS